MVSVSRSEPNISLADHMKWLESIGQAEGCTCDFIWKPRLMLWVRKNTDRACPAHGAGQCRGNGDCTC